MKKLPELVALSIGLGFLSLVGALAYHSVESEQLHQATISETSESVPASPAPMRSSIIPSGG